MVLLVFCGRRLPRVAGFVRNSYYYGFSSTCGGTVRASLTTIPFTRLFSSPTKNSKNNTNKGPNVEISPADHGTVQLTSLVENNSLHQSLTRRLRKNKLIHPTPIQAHALPLLLEGYDVMASAQTGSGKTLLFTLPLCQQLLTSSNQRRRPNHPTALVINPTRELAQQSEKVIRDLLTSSSSSRSLQTALAVGGISTNRSALAQADVVVGTPGRLLQHVDERNLHLRDVKYVVVDEADRMLDLGFEPQLRRLARSLGNRPNMEEDSTRQTILCSATFPQDVQRLAADFLDPSYYFVAAGRVGGMHQNITQNFLWVGSGGPSSRRSHVQAAVQDFLQSQPQQRVIVFCNTKDEAEAYGKILSRYNCRVVSGDKTQTDRNRAIQLFSQGKVRVLVATDVAARGLHVDNIGLVIQADMPRDVDTFVHRIGRTGRAGATGQALALVDGRSIGLAPALVDLLREAQQSIPSWLLGMSYISRARRWEEEKAIAIGSGGGGGTTGITVPTAKNTAETSFDDDATDSLFSAQDFRRDAEHGSWGAGRDTSYHEFDEEAYGSLLDVSKEVSQQPEAIRKFSPGNDDTSSIERSPFVNEDSFFERQNPSSELLNKLKSEIGDTFISQTPNRGFLQSLSKGDNQYLRFEYLGLFPFPEVFNLLRSQQNKKWEFKSNSYLPKVLMVAEKPSIAQAIAEALSGPDGPRQRRGISRALPVYEFTSNSFTPEHRQGEKRRCLMKVTSVVGHIFSLGFREEERGKNGFTDPSAYFELPVVKQEEGSTGKLRVVDHLRALAADCDHLVLWLDNDGEGENIGYEVIGVTRRAFDQKVAQDMKANPNGDLVQRIHRARFSAITKDALRDAFGSLGEADAALSRSVDARQELDLRVGVAMTRLLHWRCIGLARKNFSPATKLISYGPCQTPALSFCVDRAREIESFVARPYQQVSIVCDTPGHKDAFVEPTWMVEEAHSIEEQGDRKSASCLGKGATFDSALANEIASMVSKSGILRVTSVREIEEIRQAPLGLNTVALLTSASKAMGMSPKSVMNVAEKLYSSGYISYPRTETTRYDPNGFDVRKILNEHRAHPEWGKTVTFLLRTKYTNSGRPPLRGYDAGDHPPITPLKVATRDEVGGGNQWRVYDFITRNFIGSLSDDLTFTRRLAELEVPGIEGGPKFEISQVSVDSLGFAGSCRWVLNDIGAPNKADAESTVVLYKGLEFPVKKAQSLTMKTKPPRFLQEHELVQLMDKNRIGTDASMASHINNIVDRGYVVLCDETGTPLRPPRPSRPGQPRPPRQIGRYMVPTSLGMSLLDLFSDKSTDEDNVSASLSQLSRPSIRAQMEAEVKEIAKGEMTKEECLEKNLSWFRSKYETFYLTLSKDRINQFGRSLCTTHQSLMRWQKLGAFESPVSSTTGQDKQKNTGRRQKRRQAPSGRKQTTNDWRRTRSAVTRKRQTGISSSTQRRNFSLFMSTYDEDEAEDNSQDIERTWNLPGLKKEVQRLVLRCHKKIGKASQRLQNAQQQVEELSTNPNVSMDELESCPNIEALEVELYELKERLQGLNSLEESIAYVKGKSAVKLPEDMARLALDLGVDDKPPKRIERSPKKKKGPRREPKRLPYRRYYSMDNVEIRVGKQAEDNDQLSLSDEYRDSTDWWMHASGCPGSHVVIRCGDETLPEEVVLDAAALAARQSKCQGKVIKVSLTRCRDVVKPRGAKPGLVQLVGNVRTVSVNMTDAKERLQRLDGTVRIN
jgi:superfamily II DNA/RNA helicase/DNA topoisomerase IA